MGLACDVQSSWAQPKTRDALQKQWRQSRGDLARANAEYARAFGAMRAAESQIVATRRALQSSRERQNQHQKRFAARLRASSRAQNPSLFALLGGQSRLEEHAVRRYRFAALARSDAQKNRQNERETQRLARQLNGQMRVWAARNAYQRKVGARRANLIAQQKRFAILWRELAPAPRPKNRVVAAEIERPKPQKPREIAAPSLAPAAESAPKPRETRRQKRQPRAPEERVREERARTNGIRANRIRANRETPRKTPKRAPIQTKRREFQVRRTPQIERAAPAATPEKPTQKIAPQRTPRLAPRVEIGPRYAPRVDLQDD